MTPDAEHPALRAREVSRAHGARRALDGVSLDIARGGITVLVGPNGCGKSTLLRTLARLARPDRGAVLLDGADIARRPTREVARRLALLPQAPRVEGAITVRELVEQGRYPHVGPLGMLRRQDHAAIDEALALTGTAPLADRPLDALSGGERQRAWIALALAQATPLLLLDEPTTYLDIAHQIEVLDLVARLRRERGMTVLMVLHDLNQAARHADRLVAMRDGRIVAEGTPAEVLTEALLAEVFGIEATVVSDPVTGTPAFFPGRAAARDRRSA